MNDNIKPDIVTFINTTLFMVSVARNPYSSGKYDTFTQPEQLYFDNKMQSNQLNNYSIKLY